MYFNLTKHFPCYLKIKSKYLLKVWLIIIQQILQTSGMRQRTQMVKLNN
jgi:hypothetical protein